MTRHSIPRCRIAGCAVGALGFFLGILQADPACSRLLPVGSGAALLAARSALLVQSRGPGERPPAEAGPIVRVLSVGVVLTADGAVLQYAPDQQRWLTIDASFRLRNMETHILPLPVPVDRIREMETYGFILGDSGDCWLYDLVRDRWVKLPPARP